MHSVRSEAGAVLFYIPLGEHIWMLFVANGSHPSAGSPARIGNQSYDLDACQ
jgi:hypothetical protein